MLPHDVYNGGPDQGIFDYERIQIRGRVLNDGSHYVDSSAALRYAFGDVSGYQRERKEIIQRFGFGTVRFEYAWNEIFISKSLRSLLKNIVYEAK
jgi:hypothetical protein